MLIGILASLSAAAASALRIGLPLLMIGLLYTNDLWNQVPIMAWIHPQVVLGVLTSWSLFELLGSKKLLGQRIVQVVQLVFSPLIGGIMAVTVIKLLNMQMDYLWVIAIVGGCLALVIKLVQVGWFFRLRGIPLWWVFLEDLLCVLLVMFAFDAPQEGGIIAMLLLWIALRSSTEWREWYTEHQSHES
jgi:hypothetical protein